MHPLFPRPDLCLARCGRLDCVVTEQSVPGAPPFMRGLRALFVADTHLRPGTGAADIAALTDKIAAAGADLWLLGGDYADRAEDALRLFDGLKRLTPPRLGCYGVVGNNDAEAWPNRRELRRAMAAANCRLLVNQSVKLPLNGGRLILGGVDERKFGRPSARGLYPARPEANTYRVLLSHYPSLPDVKPDLLLAGHTHGGQFNLLGLTPFAVGFERLFRRDMLSLAVSGLHEIDGMRLLVSKGVGASRIQWRVGVRPEINLITFR